MKKYELTDNVKEWNGITLHQIRALMDFADVEQGDLGGWIEKDSNLSQAGDARVSGDAWVYGDARVYGDAKVSGNAEVYGDASVYGDAWVYGDARVSGDAKVSGDANIESLADIAVISGFGTEYRTTTFFKCKDGRIRTVCGCFDGDLDEFRKQVEDTRSGKVAEEYLMIADLMEKHFAN